MIKTVCNFVKGLAEMNMTATSAIVTLEFSYSGDNLQT